MPLQQGVYWQQQQVHHLQQHVSLSLVSCAPAAHVSVIDVKLVKVPELAVLLVRTVFCIFKRSANGLSSALLFLLWHPNSHRHMSI